MKPTIQMKTDDPKYIELEKQTKLMVEKAHLALMRHPETCQYGEVMLIGKVIIDQSFPTACTNNIDVKYNPHFMTTLTQKQANGIVLHEAIHKALMHPIRHQPQWQQDRDVMGAAVDYVTNDIILSLQDSDLCELPEGRLYNEKFHGWSQREVFDFLYKAKQSQSQPQPQPQDGDDEQDDDSDADLWDDDGNFLEDEDEEQDGDDKGSVEADGETFDLTPMDSHDTGMAGTMSSEEITDLTTEINLSLQRGGMLAGRFGTEVPRQVLDSLAPKVDWREVMREFISNSIKGKDEYTYKRLNRRYLADDYYLPTTESETIGEVVNGGDTSGSISNEQTGQQVGEVSSLCEMVEPERVRQLWWDTRVHGEQVFEPGQYADLKRLMKPVGGGGTHAGCVSDYLVDKKINAECVIMMTDGYTEQPIEWKHTAPVLWLVTQNKTFVPPAGHRMVMMED